MTPSVVNYLEYWQQMKTVLIIQFKQHGVHHCCAFFVFKRSLKTNATGSKNAFTNWKWSYLHVLSNTLRLLGRRMFELVQNYCTTSSFSFGCGVQPVHLRTERGDHFSTGSRAPQIQIRTILVTAFRWGAENIQQLHADIYLLIYV